MDFSKEYPIIPIPMEEFRVSNTMKAHCSFRATELNKVQISGRMVIEKDVTFHTEFGSFLLDSNVIIKEKVELFPSVKVITTSGQLQPRKTPYVQIGSGVVIGESTKSHAWRIGTNVWIGKNCILNEGCEIRDNCYIEDGTVIPAFSVIAPFSRIAGNPCKLVNELPPSYYGMMKTYTSTIFDKYVCTPSPYLVFLQ